MVFKFKPKISRYSPYKIAVETWGIMDRETGELLKRERYPYNWAVTRCKELNQKKDSEK